LNQVIKAMRQVMTVMTFVMWTTAAASPTFAEKPDTVPLRVATSVPQNARVGEEVTAVVSFSATADIQRLEVDVTPRDGVDVNAADAKRIFTSIPRGGSVEMRVRIKLTATRGSLVIGYTTTSAAGRGSGATAITISEAAA